MQPIYFKTLNPAKKMFTITNGHQKHRPERHQLNKPPKMTTKFPNLKQ